MDALKRPVVAIMQPTFLPWQGYFGMIAASDCFVFLDDVQFVRRSFHHRNRLFAGGSAVDWITLPIEDAGQRTPLNAARVVLDDTQSRKLLARIRHNYGRSPHFETVYTLLAGLLTSAAGRALAETNIAMIKALAELVGLSPRWMLSSELGAPGTRSRKLASILERVGAGTYLSASGSFAYMQADRVFPQTEIDTVFQRFEPLAYPQRQSPAFVEKLSVVDALFQVGPEETRALILSGSRRPITWDERAALSAQHEEPETDVAGLADS